MWWLQLAAVIGFAVLLVGSFIVWRREGAPGTSRSYMIGLFVAGVVMVAVGVWLLAATA